MQLTMRKLNGVDVVGVLAERIDAAVAIRFKDEVRAITSQSRGRVVLDLSRVDFIDSSGLGAIVAAMKQLDGQAALDLAGLQPNVDRVFRLTRMDTVFAIHATAETACPTHAQ
ncbi:STAS domain-containing protein [Pseudooceanicola sp. CBS1P-1]|uniref:Anti-sigma factor antagonist n=1 Tax=Pseudooceanicola albus TaxID=2692189 RepID=A0A6L7GBL8_9RHOB|nr:MULTISPECIES: STAS domain-containing protein [Pseudooceanicola]MBT9386680.1 STAS domain-containing protein [Pseudooceanicola endophyticus]MXN20908.1 anti-sigma factor antagonist [Pseudooceanicola albus]